MMRELVTGSLIAVGLVVVVALVAVAVLSWLTRGPVIRFCKCGAPIDSNGVCYARSRDEIGSAGASVLVAAVVALTVAGVLALSVHAFLSGEIAVGWGLLACDVWAALVAVTAAPHFGA